MNVGAGCHRGFEDRRVKLQNPITFGGRSFGKQCHAVAFGESAAHQIVDACGVVAPCASNEKGSRPLRDPAGDGPVANLALGDEARRSEARDEKDIEPRDVIGRDHRGTFRQRRRRTFEAHRHIEDTKHLRRPPAHETAPARGARARENEAQDQRCHDRVHEHARPAQPARRAASSGVRQWLTRVVPRPERMRTRSPARNASSASCTTATYLPESSSTVSSIPCRSLADFSTCWPRTPPKTAPPIAPALCPVPPPTWLPARPPSTAPVAVSTPVSCGSMRPSRTDSTMPKRTDCSPRTS